MFKITAKNKQKNTHLFAKSLSAIMITSLLNGCIFEGDSDEDTPATQTANVNFVLAPVDGGSCLLLDPYSNMATIAGPADTASGIAQFQDVASDTGLVLIECTGGTYEDEATGLSMTPDTLRAYINVTSSEFNATVSPLTEVAARVVDYYDLSPEDYPAVLANIARSFGLEGVDLTSTTPLDTNVEVMDGSDSGNYGLVLAALSQLQQDYGVDDAEFVIEELFIGMANNGLFTNEDIRESYFYALDNMFNNPRIDPSLGSDEHLDKFFHDVVLAPVASQVEYIDADHPQSHNLEALGIIDAYETSIFDIVGTHLSLKLDVTLAGEHCLLHDLQIISDTSSDTKYNLMYAECPAQQPGEATILVKDTDGRIENSTTITVVEPGSYNYSEGVKTALSSKSKNKSAGPATGSSYVFGYVSGEAPFIDPSVSAAHDYSSDKISRFDVKGVTVELINAAKEVIATTSTFNDGYYEFSNAPESTSVSVVVKAEVKKTRTTGDTGLEYNFSVRDNTSASIPRKLYQISTPYFTTLASAGSDNPQQDIVAALGFNENGSVISEAQRQSAPFAILRTMKAGADALSNINPNVSLPTLNIYWSSKNIGSDGNKNVGQIGTSHYAGKGLQPGLYILGKADSDTDEFDQGVIGHEFGHYLQDKLSYSDSPGGSHSDDEHKDASLAYGEGYGTAIGGLLSGSQYYCDVSGDNQLGGWCMNLTDRSVAGEVAGFYSENSIITLLYAIGTLPGKGLNEFFGAVTTLKEHMHSATIFSFLHHYLEANPDVSNEVASLMAAHNIKSSEPFGVLPAGAVADPKISAANNRGDAQSGADDLEKLYIELTLDNVASPFDDESPALLTSSSTPFCLNRNLQGANSHNGLGMRKRFTFTSNFTGKMLVRKKNKLDHIVSDQNTLFSMRDEDGQEVIFFDYNGVDSADYYARANVVEGKKYSLKMSMFEPQEILNGSQCGYKVELARAAD